MLTIILFLFYFYIFGNILHNIPNSNNDLTVNDLTVNDFTVNDLTNLPYQTLSKLVKRLNVKPKKRDRKSLLRILEEFAIANSGEFNLQIQKFFYEQKIVC